MTKKEYMKPTMKTVELKQRTMILAGSVDAYGMKKSLLNEEVTEAWSPDMTLPGLDLIPDGGF